MVLDTVRAVHALGVKVSMDDFGTGYSSLSHLHRLPIGELKLDKSLVQDIEHDELARALTVSVLRIGKTLGLTVVAEGVETEAQRRFVADEGCPVVQGYLISRPVAGGGAGGLAGRARRRGAAQSSISRSFTLRPLILPAARRWQTLGAMSACTAT